MDAAAPTTSVKNRLIKGFAWFAAARIIVNLLTFASSIILARLLMPEDFGLVALAIGLQAVVSALAQLPIGEALIQRDVLEDNHLHSAFTLGLMRGSLLCILLVLGAWPAAAVYDDARLVPILLLMAANALVSGFYSPRWPLIQKQLSFAPSFIMETTARFTSFLIAIPIAYYYRSYWAIIVPISVWQILSVVLTYVFAPYRPRFSTQRIRDIWSFSVWVTLSSFFNTFNLRIDALLIGGVLGQRAVGFYSYGDDKAALPTREIGGSMIQLLFPGLAMVKNEQERLVSGYKRMQSLLFAVCAPAGIGFALVADEFVYGLLGAKWAPIIPIVQVIAFALALENLITPARPLAMALGATRSQFHREALAFAIRVPLTAIGLWLFAIEGVLAARLISSVVTIGIFMLFVRQLVGLSVREQLTGSLRSCLALGIMGAGLILYKALPMVGHLPHLVILVSAIALGAVLYTIGHASIWVLAGRPAGPEREIIEIVQSVLNRRRASR
jgi:O-antigen/teichoic acid export membrane protein